MGPMRRSEEANLIAADLILSKNQQTLYELRRLKIRDTFLYYPDTRKSERYPGKLRIQMDEKTLSNFVELDCPQPQL